MGNLLNMYRSNRISVTPSQEEINEDLGADTPESAELDEVIVPAADVPAEGEEVVDPAAAAAEEEPPVPAEGEEPVVPADGEAEVSQEGFLGGLAGFLVGSTVAWAPFVGPAVHSTVKIKRLKLREDIQTIAKRIEKIRRGDLADAEKNGMKVPEKLKDVNWTEIIKSAVLGTFFGPFYGAWQGSDLENLNNELRAKLKELEKELEVAGISTEDMEMASPAEAEEPAPEGGESGLDEVGAAVVEAAEGEEDPVPAEPTAVPDPELPENGEPVEDQDVPAGDPEGAPSEEPAPEGEEPVAEGEEPAAAEGDVENEFPGGEEPVSESAEGEEPVEEEEGSDLDEDMDDLDESVDDVEVAAEMIMFDINRIEQLASACESLDALRLEVASHRAVGGMTAGVARMAAMLVSNEMRVLGTPEVVLVPSAENFGAASSRMYNTTVSYENIGEYVKAGVAKLLELLAAMKEKFQTFWNNIWDSSAKLRKGAESLRASADSATASGGNMEPGKWADRLAVGGRFPNDVKGALTALHQSMGDVQKSYIPETHTACQNIVQAMESIKCDNDETFHSTSAGKLGKIQLPVPNIGNRAGPDGTKISAELPGGYVVQHKAVNVEGDKMADEVRALSQSYDRVVRSPDYKELTAGQVPAVNASDAKDIAGAVVAIADLIDGIKADKEKEGAIKDSLIKSAKDLGQRAASGNLTDSVKSEITALMNLSKVGSNYLDSLSGSMISYAIGTAQAALQYGAASLKATGDEKKPAQLGAPASA